MKPMRLTRGFTNAGRALLALAMLTTLLAYRPPSVDAQLLPQVELVSVGDAGQQTVSNSGLTVDESGDLVGFSSEDSDLVRGDTNGVRDGFIRTRSLGITERVTLAEDGSELAQGANLFSMSSNGRFVVFSSDDPNVFSEAGSGLPALYLRDRQAGDVERIDVSTFGNPANAGPSSARVSNDGNIVAFTSSASNLAASDTNGRSDVFLRNRVAGTTKQMRLPGIAWATSSAPDLTPDGRFLAFNMQGRMAVRFDVVTGELHTLSSRRAGGSSISADGMSMASRIALTSNRTGIDVADLSTGEVQPVSADATGRIARGLSNGPSMSDDGSLIAFWSDSEDIGYNVDPAVSQAYMFDRRTGLLRLISVNALGELANSRILNLEISGDGSTVFLRTAADNLVGEDTNGASDIFAVRVDAAGPQQTCRGIPATIVGAGEIVGTDGDDVILGSFGPDIIDSGDGDDVICSLGGDDVINSGAGDDVVIAGPGADAVHGGLGIDRVFAGDGDDVVRGGAGVDMVFGGAGDDLVFGDSGADQLGGGAGTDRIIGGADDDALGGGAGEDVCKGSGGSDRYFQCEVLQP